MYRTGRDLHNFGIAQVMRLDARWNKPAIAIFISQAAASAVTPRPQRPIFCHGQRVRAAAGSSEDRRAEGFHTTNPLWAQPLIAIAQSQSARAPIAPRPECASSRN